MVGDSSCQMDPLYEFYFPSCLGDLPENTENPIRWKVMYERTGKHFHALHPCLPQSRDNVSCIASAARYIFLDVVVLPATDSFSPAMLLKIISLHIGKHHHIIL